MVQIGLERELFVLFLTSTRRHPDIPYVDYLGPVIYPVLLEIL